MSKEELMSLTWNFVFWREDNDLRGGPILPPTSSEVRKFLRQVNHPEKDNTEFIFTFIEFMKSSE